MSRWPEVNLRRLAKLGTGHTPSRQHPEYWENCTIPWLTLADVWQLRDGTKSRIGETSEKISEVGLVNSAAVVHPAGTVAMSRTASVGFSCILDRDMATSQDFVTWTCGPLLDPRFLLYSLRAQRNQILGMRMGSTHQTIYMPDVERITTPLPPIAQQRAVADFLDTEAARIDALIAKKRRMLDLLDEQIDARVMSWVGRSPLAGGDEIYTVPIRRVLRRREQWVDHGEMVTAFRDGVVTKRATRGRDGFTNAWTDGAKFQRVRVGDVVVHGLDGFAGAIGDAQQSGVCSPVYHVCDAGEGDGAFYGRLLRLLAITGHLGNFATSTRERAVDFRNWDLFGRIPVPSVPLAEQKAIGEQIRRNRPLRDRILASEALAQEHRQALITAAVTGEMDVPGVAA